MLTTISIASGNVTDAANWSGGVVPGPGSYVTIDPAHLMTVPAGFTWTPGNPAAPRTPALSIGGELRIRGQLGLLGDARFTGTAGELTIHAGGSLESQHPTSALTLFNNGGRILGRGTGIRAARGRIAKGARSPGLSVTRDRTRKDIYWAHVDLQFMTLEHIAEFSASNLAESDPGEWLMSDVWAMGTVFTTSGLNWSKRQRFQWHRVTQQATPGSTSATITGYDAPAAAGLRTLSQVSFDRMFVCSMPGIEAERVVFRERWDMNVPFRSLVDPVIASTRAGDGVTTNVHNGITGGLCVHINPVATNTHGINIVAPGNHTIDGLVFDGFVADDVGDCIMAASPSAPVSITIRNVIGTKAAVPSGSLGKLLSLGGGPSVTVPLVENCLWFTSSGESALVGTGETYAGRSDMVQVVRSNIVIGLTPNAGTLHFRQDAGAARNVRDIVTPAGIYNNCVFNPCSDGTRPVGTRTARGGDGVVYSSAPRASLTVDPQLTNANANPATWYRTLVGGTPARRDVDTLLALDAIASVATDTPVAGATIPALRTYLRSAMTPNNPALRTNVTAANNGWIGPVDGGGAPLPARTPRETEGDLRHLSRADVRGRTARNTSHS